jgi:hypothetical protein
MLTSKPLYLLAISLLFSTLGSSQNPSFTSNTSYASFASNETKFPDNLNTTDWLSWKRSSKDSLFILHKNGSFAKWSNQGWSELIWYFEGGANLFVDKDDNVWLLSTKIGLHKYKNGRFTFWGNTNDRSAKDYIPSAKLYDMAQDGQGFYWICSDEGILRFDGKDFILFDAKASGLASNHTRSIVIDNKGMIWVGTADNGIVCFDGKTWKHYNTKNSTLKADNVSKLVIDANGDLLVSHTQQRAASGSTYRFTPHSN